MGLAVPVSTEVLLRKHNVKALSEIAKTGDLEPQEQQKPKYQRTNPYAQEQHEPQPQAVNYAEDIMSNKVVALYDDMKFFDAWQKFRSLRYRHFPVLDVNNLIVGIISDRDMLAMAASQKPANLHINQIMKREVLTAAPHTLIRDVCQVMFNRHIGALPITDHKNQLLGMITRSDILRAMIKNGPIQLWA